MNHAKNLLSVANLLHFDRVGLRLQDQSVQRMLHSARLFADVVSGKRERMSLPNRGQRLSVRRERPENPIRIRNEKRRADPVTQVAVRSVIHVQHLLGLCQVRRIQHVHISLAGEVSGNLQHFHPAARRDHHAGELRLGGAHGFAREGDNLLAANLSYSLGVCHHH